MRKSSSSSAEPSTETNPLAMLLVAYLDDGHVRDRPLGAADHALIDPVPIAPAGARADTDAAGKPAS